MCIGTELAQDPGIRHRSSFQGRYPLARRHGERGGARLRRDYDRREPGNSALFGHGGAERMIVYPPLL